MDFRVRPEMETMRAFIAIELPSEIKASLATLQKELKQGANFVRFVDPEGIHLTLKFLGSVDSKKLPGIIDAIDAVAEKIPPFKLGLERVGVFPSMSRPRVIWVGTTGDVEMLLQLQKNIEDALLPFGFAKESRQFTAHLTLARIRERMPAEELETLRNAISSTQYKYGGYLNVDSVSLMRSILTPKGALHSQISSTKLKG